MPKHRFSMIVVCVVAGITTPAKANIMCDPGWLHGRATTIDLTLNFLAQMTSHNRAAAGRGAEARVCPKLEQFRLFVNGGCISARHLPKVEAMFEPYACAPPAGANNG